MSRLFSMKSFGLSILAAALAVTFTPNALAQSGDASVVKKLNLNELIPRKNSVPAQVATSTDEGRTGSAVVEGVIGLRHQGDVQEALNTLERGLIDPKSPFYKQWLTPSELAQNFPANPADVAKLTEWLQSYGLTVTRVDNARLVLTFSGPASQVEKAFNTEIHNLTAADGSRRYSNTTNPRIVATMYGLTRNLKLDNFPSEMPNYSGRVVSAPKGTESVELKPAAAEEAAAAKTGTGALKAMGFTITPGFVEPGASTPQTLTVTLEIKAGQSLPSGTLLIHGDEKLGSLGTIDAKDCNAVETNIYACSSIWAPSDMPTGIHQVTASYSGDAAYAPAFTKSTIRSFGTVATYTSMSASSINTHTSTAITFTSVTTWTGTGAAPAGTDAITFSCGDASTTSTACETLPTSPATVSACTVSTTAQTITCTFSYNVYGDEIGYGSEGLTATFGGDSTYAASNGTVFVDGYQHAGAGTLTLAVSPTTVAPGGNVTYTAVYTPSTYSITTINPTTTSGPTYMEFTGVPTTGGPGGGATGNVIVSGTSSSCTASTSANTVTCTTTVAVPSTTPQATYTVSDEFSGQYYDEAQTGSTSLTVAKTNTTATETGATYGTSTPATTTQAAGSLSAFTVYGTVAWTGAGTAPTVGNITFTSTAAGTTTGVSCATGTLVYNCSATFTPTSTDAAGIYAVDITFSGDSLYNSSTATATGNYVITGTPTLSMSPSTVTAPATSTTGITVTATSSEIGAVVTFGVTSPATGSYSPATCTIGSGGTCTSSYVPTGSLAIGTYTNDLTASIPAASPFTAASTTATLSIVAPTATFGTMAFSPAASENQGTSQAITISDPLTYNGGTAPSGATTFVLNGVTYTATCTGSSPQSCSAVVPAATIAALAPAAYPVTVSLAAGGAYAAATGANGTFTIKGTTTTTDSATPTLVYGVEEGNGTTATETTTVTGVLSWTGSVTPTGTMTLSCDATSPFASIGTCSSLPAAVNLTTCTLNASAKTYTCSIAYNLDSNNINNNGAGTYYMVMTYSGDANYVGSASTTAPAAVIDSYGDPISVVVSASPPSVVVGAGTSVTYTVTITDTGEFEDTFTGTLTLSGTPITGTPISKAASSCTQAVNSNFMEVATCTITAIVPTATAAGSYTVTASYSGDVDYEPNSGTTTLNVTGTTSDTTTVSATPTNVTGTAGTTVITTVTTWTGSGATPTGNVTLYYSEPQIPVGNTLITTIAASSCTANTTAKTLTCNYTWDPGTQPVAYYGLQDIQAIYSGDSTYIGSTSSVFPIYYTGATSPTSMTFVLNPTSSTFGTAQTVSFSGSIVGAADNKTLTGAVVLIYAPGNNSYIATGTFGTCSTTGTGSTKIYTCPYSGTFSVPATQNPGAYVYTATYDGNGTFTSYSQTATYTVNSTDTLSAVTITPSTIAYGSTGTVSATLSWTGAGAGPGSGNSIITFTASNNSVPAASATFSNESCTYLTNSVTCTATLTPATTDTIGTVYTVIASYTATTGYPAPTSGTGTWTYAKAATTMNPVTITPSTVFAAGTAQVSATLTWSGTGAAPGTGNSIIAFTANNNSLSQPSATFSGETCTVGTNTLTCTATLTPAATDTPGTNYTVTATYAASTNYLTSSNTGTWTYGVTSQGVSTPTATPTSPSTYNTNVTFSTTHSYTGTTAPSGVTVTFTIKNGSTTVATLTATCGAYTANSQACTASDALLPGSATYTVTASVTADTTDGYPAATSSGSLSYTVNQTYGGNVGVSATSEPYNVAIPLSVTLSGYTSTADDAVPPSGTVTFTVTQGATTIGTATCTLPSTGTTNTSTGCSTTYPAGLAVGTYTVTANYPGNSNYTSNSNSTTFTVTSVTTTLALTGATNGTTSAGVTTDALTATSNLAVAGITVTFTDTTNSTTLGTASTNASGVATLTVTTSTTGISGGKNLITASITGTGNYSSATSTALTTYFQGILFSFIGTHNFSGLLTGSADPYSCCGGPWKARWTDHGGGLWRQRVQLHLASQTLPVTLTNAASGAFSLSNQCGATLSAGERARWCSTTRRRTAMAALRRCRRRWAPARWMAPAIRKARTRPARGATRCRWACSPARQLRLYHLRRGRGQRNAGRQGACSTVVLSVSPTTAAFGSVAQGATSNTITITVTNSNSSAVVLHLHRAEQRPLHGHHNTCTQPAGGQLELQHLPDDGDHHHRHLH
jgi:hypothetical protein